MKGLEAKIQKQIIDALEERGYFVINLIKTNKNGIPDLIALKDKHKALFIEVKQSTGQTTKLQDYMIKQLNNKGFISFIAKSVNDVLTRIE